MARRSRDDRQLGLFGAGQPAAHAADAGAALAVLPEAPPALVIPPDAADRDYAVDPRHNVVLEASAGTGKTTVLVRRYVNLLDAGVEPAHILAITFTRKAAAEMRQRIVAELQRDAALSDAGRRRWLRLRDHVGDIAISTIDAFCLSLLREFPLEANLDPSFEIADDTEVARLVERTLDATLRIARARAREQPDVAFVLTQLTSRQLRDGLRHLLDRRAIALPALDRYLRGIAVPRAAADAVRVATQDVLSSIETARGGLSGWLADGPQAVPAFALLTHDLHALRDADPGDGVAWRRAFDHLRDYFLTEKGDARRKLQHSQQKFPDRGAYERHRDVTLNAAPTVARLADRLDREVNGALARGIQALAHSAAGIYARAMEEEDVLDFTGTLQRAVGLLENMDEFSRSRFRLESRYHHVLVDEFQDTNRLQWKLVSLLVEAWGAGEGMVSDPVPPTVFVVGDRKQSIYRFRDAEVALLDEAARHIALLRPGDRPRRSISTSFRSTPALLAFVNDLFGDVAKAGGRADAFRYDDTDRFPLSCLPAVPVDEPPLGIAAATSAPALAGIVAAEIVRLLREGAIVRDRATGLRRAVQAGDVAILFRSRDSHREYERALDARGVPTYVYKGLGFFDADEIQDLSALVRYLASPASRVREAALLRSRLFRVSDAALAALSADLGRVLRGTVAPAALDRLAPDDREVITLARRAVAEWLALVDRVPPADLLDRALRDTGYAYELRGGRLDQARENVKKFRGLVRRIQNRGYATLGRLADHLDRLSAGDESNAAIDAVNAVNLMTVHAAKGLEFPIVFVVNLARGTGTGGPAVRVIPEDGQGEPSVSIGTLRFEADEEEKLRDREETKRLLYVALTRARDRLYLASVLTADGRLRPTPGSLAEVLPPSACALFESAAGAATPHVSWRASIGTTHHFRRCVADPDHGERMATAARPSRVDVLEPLPAGAALTIQGVREAVQGTPGDRPATLAPGAADMIAGRLVHRLFQRLSCDDADLDARSLAVRAAGWLTEDERERVADVESVVVAACETWRRLARRDGVREVFAGDTYHEVPFTLIDGGRAVRGVIDCIVRRQPDEVRVIEIKTGRRAAWHDEQLAIYVRAARALFPSARVDGVLLTPEQT